MKLFTENQNSPFCVRCDKDSSIFIVLEKSDYDTGLTADQAEAIILQKYPYANMRNYFTSDFLDAIKGFRTNIGLRLNVNPEYQVVGKYAKETGKGGGIIQFTTVRYNHPTRGAIERTYQTVISEMKTGGYDANFEYQSSGGKTGNEFSLNNCQYKDSDYCLWI